LSAEELAEISRSIELGYLDQHGLQKCRALFAHISALDRELAEARKDSERLDWLEAHRHVSLRHWTNGCIVELFDEKYWHYRHNQRDERFCDNYRQLLDHQLKYAAQRGEKG